MGNALLEKCYNVFGQISRTIWEDWGARTPIPFGYATGGMNMVFQLEVFDKEHPCHSMFKRAADFNTMILNRNGTQGIPHSTILFQRPSIVLLEK